jgi:hypothetical protein
MPNHTFTETPATRFGCDAGCDAGSRSGAGVDRPANGAPGGGIDGGPAGGGGGGKLLTPRRYRTGVTRLPEAGCPHGRVGPELSRP